MFITVRMLIDSEVVDKSCVYLYIDRQYVLYIIHNCMYMYKCNCRACKSREVKDSMTRCLSSTSRIFWRHREYDILPKHQVLPVDVIEADNM
jgi:hypothetical protein